MKPMKTIWIIIVLIACVLIVGKIDYESALAMDEFRLPAARAIYARRAAAKWGDE